MPTSQVKLARQGGAVRLTMSAAVANDLAKLREGLRGIADRLGHSACATGCDILHMGLEEEFTVTTRASKVELNPQPLPPRVAAEALGQVGTARGTVAVAVPAKVSDNIESLIGAVEVVLGKLGCRPCCSGFDIIFQREVDFMAVDEKLNVTGFGRYR